MLLSSGRPVTIRSAQAALRSATDFLHSADLAPARPNAPLAQFHQGPYASMLPARPGGLPLPKQMAPLCVGAPDSRSAPAS